MTDSFYFDNQTVTKPFPEVLEKFFRFSKEYWASSTSSHFLGQQQIYPLQKSIESLFAQLGMQDQDQIFFTSGGAEAIYQVFLTTYMQRVRETGKTLFLVAETEEAKVLSMGRQLELLGCSFKTLAVNAKGQVLPEVLEAAITPRTALVSLSWANGLTGVLQPIAALAEVCKNKGVFIHVDASYVWGKSFFRFQDLGADFLTLDGAAIHAPKDTGLTIVKAGFAAEPLIPGKEELSTPSIAAFSKAIEMMQEKFEHYAMEIACLRDRFEQGIVEAFPKAQILFKDADRLPNTSALAFPPIFSESLLFLLNTKGIYASLGGGKFQPLALVLKASGLDEKIGSSALSFCLSYDMTEEDIDRAVEIITECAKQLQAVAGDLHV
jgi:cysteine desulfurase